MRTPIRTSIISLLSCAWIALTPIAEATETAATKTSATHTSQHKAVHKTESAAKSAPGKTTASKTTAAKTAAAKPAATHTSTHKSATAAKSAAKPAVASKTTSKATGKTARKSAAAKPTVAHRSARKLAAPAAVAAGAGAALAAKSATAREAGPLRLSSNSAMVVDLDNDKVLFSEQPDTVRPIASISKLMTAVVTLDANLPMDELIPVTIHDTKELQGVYSRVRVGSLISRKEMLRLALMSSENRAASALAHNYPGGHARFVAAMNAKARALGMTSTHYDEPTGLSKNNVSTARDLVRLLKAARQYPMIHELSTTPSKTAVFENPSYVLGFNNTNPLTRNPGWDIEITKTGFINEAGHCLALLTRVQDRPVAMVLLDTTGKHSHIGDATRVRRWLETGHGGEVPAAARSNRPVPEVASGRN